MKLGEPSRLVREALPDAPAGEWIDLLLEHINKKGDETTQALTQNLTIADNMNAAIVTYRMTHATERTIKNPLKGRPVGIKAIRSAAIAGGVRYTVNSVDWRFVESTSATDPQQLGITVRYAAPCGTIRLRKSANQTGIASGAITGVTWDIHDLEVVGGLSHSTTTNTTRITCTSSGIVRVSYVLVWSALAYAANNRVGGLVWKNGSGAGAGQRWATTLAQANGVQDCCCATDLVNVTAGDYLEINALQTNTTATAIDLAGNTDNECSATAEYVSPPATAQNDVSFVVYGG